MTQPIIITVPARQTARQWRKLLDGQLRSAEALHGANAMLALEVCACDEPEGSTDTKITLSAAPIAPAPEKPSGEG